MLTDNALGMHPNATVYSDMDADQLETLAPTQIHRNVDLMILAADKEGQYFQDLPVSFSLMNAQQVTARVILFCQALFMEFPPGD